MIHITLDLFPFRRMALLQCAECEVLHCSPACPDWLEPQNREAICPVLQTSNSGKEQTGTDKDQRSDFQYLVHISLAQKLAFAVENRTSEKDLKLNVKLLQHLFHKFSAITSNAVVVLGPSGDYGMMT